MSARPKLLLVSFTDLTNDPRPYKEWLCLHKHFEITELAYASGGRSDHFFAVHNNSPSIFKKIVWGSALLAGKYRPYLQRYSTSAFSYLHSIKFDMVIAHNINTCPLAFSLAKEAPVLIDLHEYLPGECEESFKWRLLFQRPVFNLCKYFLPRAAALLTPSEGVAKKYANEFKVDSAVNYNAPPFVSQGPSPVEDRISLVHHGVAAKERCTDKLLDLMDHLEDRFHLHLYMVGTDDFYRRIRDRALKHPRISWHDPVPMPTLSRALNPYDIGIAILPPSNSNHELTIGNKIFEFIQARLAIVAWPTVGIKHLLEKYGVGICSEEASVESMAQIINSLAPKDIMQFKKASDVAARELTAEKSMQVIARTILDINPEKFSFLQEQC